MVKMNFSYQGNLCVEATHEPSKTTIKSAAPLDNNGDGSSFSPSDLLASATVTCMITLMGISANKNNINIAGTTASVEKEMVSNPRRVGKLTIAIHVPQKLSTEEQKLLKTAALNCPVAKSIHPDITCETTFYFG
jgi:uncharacterized OsmC-like protein